MKMMKRSSTRRRSPRAVAETEMVSEKSGSSVRECPKWSRLSLVRERMTSGRGRGENLSYTRRQCAACAS